MFNQLVYKGINTGPGLSYGLWANAPDRIVFDRNAGFFYMDDFFDPPVTAQRYQMVADATGSFGNYTENDAYGGIARAALAATDNDESYMGSGNDLGTLLAFDTKANGGHKFWWETRIRVSVVTDFGLIVGLGEPTIIAANLLADNTHAEGTSLSFVGFLGVGATPTTLDGVHWTTSTAMTTGIAGTAGTLVAATWIKLGGYFDPDLGYEYFINGVSLNPTAKILPAATNFPDGIGLEFVIGAKNGTAAARNVDIDWWAIGMQLDDY